MKTRWLIPLALVLILAIGTLGAFAYFSSTASAAGNIRAGSLNLDVAGVAPSVDCATIPNAAWGDTTALWQYQNLAPGDVATGRLCMKNIGTLDIKQVGFNWSGMPLLLAENLFVTKLVNSQTGEEISAYIGACDGKTGNPTDGKMSLAELWGCNGSGEDEYWVGGVATFLPVSAPIQWVEYEFVFNTEAGNDLQGAYSDYSLIITGYQQPKY